VPEPVAVTGIGLVTAVGWTPDEVWRSIAEGRSGLGELTLFESPRCGHLPIAEVRGNPAGRSSLASGSRSDHLAEYAAGQAFKAANLETAPRRINPRAGVVVGGSTGGMLEAETFLEKLINEREVDLTLIEHYLCASSTDAIAARFGLGAFRSTVSTACSSSALAIATACDVIKSGEADVMLAGGVDSLTRLTLNGFASLLIVAEDGCRPFDEDRKGMSLGEGAAFLVLENEKHAADRGAEILARVIGYGSTCDSHHATAPDPEGDGIRRAMEIALKDAGIPGKDIDYINAHGTGTLDNDRAEANAVLGVFGKEIPLISSTKRFFGHTLAAAGAIEAAVCIMALRRQQVPGNLGLRKVEEGIEIAPVRETQNANLKTAMTNSLGFGGNNVSMIFGLT